jgi:hypothetical protein
MASGTAGHTASQHGQPWRSGETIRSSRPVWHPQHAQHTHQQPTVPNVHGTSLACSVTLRAGSAPLYCSSRAARQEPATTSAAAAAIAGTYMPYGHVCHVAARAGWRAANFVAAGQDNRCIHNKAAHPATPGTAITSGSKAVSVVDPWYTCHVDLAAWVSVSKCIRKSLRLA